MHFADYGQGSVVLLLHAVPGTIESFAPLARALSAHARVLVPAMPGYGPSPRIQPYDLDRVREVLEDELLSRGVTSCSIVGHSAGTYRALSMALSGRVRVEALVLLGAVAGFDETGRDKYRQLSTAARAGADLRPIYDTAVAPEFAKRHPESVRLIVNALDACTRDVLADELGAFANAADLRPLMGNIRCRTLLRVGEVDLFTPVALSQALASSIPDARIQIVPGCGHYLLQEDERGTIDAVTSWLRAEPREANVTTRED